MIALWQSSFISPSVNLEGPRFGMRGGASGRPAHMGKFVYFYHHLGLLPLATLLDEPENTKEAALNILNEQPQTLRTEIGIATRFGDLGRILLLMPSVWLGASPHQPKLQPLYYPLFCLLLWGLFVALWYRGYCVLAVSLTLLVGSHPFQLLEVYRTENFHGWHIFNALALLILCLPYFESAENSKYPHVRLWLWPALAGLWLGFAKSIRPEILAMGLSPLVIYALAPLFSKWQKVVMMLGFVLAFVSVNQSLKLYFEHKTAQANRVLLEHGGIPHVGKRDTHHQFWHPLWCGLGDFDRKYGHCWNDIVAAHRTVPELIEQTGIPFKWPVPFPEGCSIMDENGLYVITPYEQPEHERILRNEVLHRLRTDPFWYAEILLKRVRFLFTSTPPPSLKVGPYHIRLPLWGGLFFVLALVWAWFKRDGFALRLLLFSTPMAATALGIYALKGNADYVLFPVVAVAVLISYSLRRISKVWPAKL